VLVAPSTPRNVVPEACMALQKAAPNGFIDVGCKWEGKELAPECNSRLTPKGAMALLK